MNAKDIATTPEEPVAQGRVWVTKPAIENKGGAKNITAQQNNWHWTDDAESGLNFYLLSVSWNRAPQWLQIVAAHKLFIVQNEPKLFQRIVFDRELAKKYGTDNISRTKDQQWGDFRSASPAIEKEQH